MNYIYFINSIKKVIFYMFLTGVLVFSVIAERQPLTNYDFNILNNIIVVNPPDEKLIDEINN